jgi:hypothetical protein
LWIVLTVAFVISLALWPIGFQRAVASPATEDGPNLLQDGDFEWSAPWDAQDGMAQIRIAPRWRAWWVPDPPSSIPRPYNCLGGKDYGCYWAVPEFGDVQRLAYVYRVHSGYQAQKYFTYGRMHEAGLMQKVSNIQPGARLRFSIYMQAWMCFDFAECNYGKVSDKPSDMHLRIGIDPTGGDNPFSPDIVWSPEQAAWDAWALFQVEAVARNSTVTVFTHSRPDWDWARTNNDVYLDDASLVVVAQSPPSRPTQPPAPRVQPTQLPRSTATLIATSTATPTLTPTATATETPLPTETPVRRVATLPPEDTATSAPPSLVGGLTSSGSDSPGKLIGVVFLAVAFLLSVLLIVVVIGQRRNAKVG